MSVLLVALGASLGAPARYLVDRWLQHIFVTNHPKRIPVGTLGVNVLGSGILGVVDARLTGGWLLLLGTGFCGAFTTFSTFAALTEESFREGWTKAAWANIVASLGLCLAAFAVAFEFAGG
jgi:CrcB protein